MIIHSLCLFGYFSVLVAYIFIGSTIVRFLKNYDRLLYKKNQGIISFFFCSVIVFLLFRNLVYLDVYFFQTYQRAIFIYLRMIGTYSSELMLTNFMIAISLKNIKSDDRD